MSIAAVLELFEAEGGSAYVGEDVTQRDHALQAAALAERAGAAPALVAAALLHDVGHLLVLAQGRDAAPRVTDQRHQDVGADWLAGFLPPEVTEPVRLHVAAKRYLCAVEPVYAEGLSAGSQASLALQGGPFDPERVRAFEAQPAWRDAVRLRRWDDAAKVPGLRVPALGHYRPLLEALSSARAARGAPPRA